jgi:hypothetical protein
MPEQYARGYLAQRLAGLHLGRRCGELPHDLARLAFLGATEQLIASQPSDGRVTLG